MTTEMELVVGCDGGVRCIYDEALEQREIGKLQITRASHVEPDAEGYWWAEQAGDDQRRRRVEEHFRTSG